MYTGIKSLANFVYRTSVPRRPSAGTFYWVENNGESKLFFSDRDNHLIRLDSGIVSVISNDNNFIVEKEPDGIIKIKLKYGDFSNKTDERISRVCDVINYFKSMVVVDTNNGIVKFNDEYNINTYYTPLKRYTNDVYPEIVETEKESYYGGTVYFEVLCDDNYDVYYTTSSSMSSIRTPRVYGTLLTDKKKLGITVSSSFRNITRYICLQSKSKESGLWSNTRTYECVIRRKLLEPTVSINSNYVDEYSSEMSFTVNKNSSNTSSASIFYGYSENDINNVLHGNTISGIDRKSNVTLYVQSRASGYVSSDIVSYGPVEYGRKPMYWDVVDGEPNLNISSLRNKIKSKPDNNGNFTVEVNSLESNVSSAYGRMIFAYDKSYGELTSIEDRNGSSMNEQFYKVESGDYYYYILKEPSIYTGVTTVFKK